MRSSLRSRLAAAPRQLAALAAALASAVLLLWAPPQASFSLAPPRLALSEKLNVEAPIPWNMDEDERLRRQLGYLRKKHDLKVNYFKVLDAAQYMNMNEVHQVLKGLELRRDSIENPTEWTCERLEERTKMKLSPLKMPLEMQEKVFRTVQWLNRECEFDIYVSFDDIMPTAYNADYGVTLRILNRVRDLVNIVGNEEVRHDPTSYINFALTRFKRDRIQIRKWVDWQNEHGGLQQQLDWEGVRQVHRTYDRKKFWEVISESEDTLSELEDPMEHLMFKLQLPGEISRFSKDYFDDEVDVGVVEEAAEGMQLALVMQALEEAAQRRWEIESDPTGFLVAMMDKAREEGLKEMDEDEDDEGLMD